MSLATSITEKGSERRRLSPSEFRDLIGRFASGVTVITAQHEGKRFGTTASAVTSLSLEPPMLLVCLNKTSATGQAVAQAYRFAVNILGEDQADAAMWFAGKGDKFTGVTVARGAAGEPLLQNALANLECRVVEEVTGGTHSVFLAEVEHATGRDGAPLAYFRGQFGRLELAQDDEAFRDIRAKVLSRELPTGKPITLDEVADIAGVPRGSAYHALTKLIGEGLVTRTAEGQFRVTSLTLTAVLEALEARRAIELGVAACTVGRVSTDQLVDFRAAVEATRPSVPFDINANLSNYERCHEVYVGLVGSQVLVDAHRRVNTATMIMRVTAKRVVGEASYWIAAESAYRHHIRLLKAYQSDDLATAIRAIHHHIDDAIIFTQRHMEAVGGAL